MNGCSSCACSSKHLRQQHLVVQNAFCQLYNRTCRCCKTCCSNLPHSPVNETRTQLSQVSSWQTSSVSSHFRPNTGTAVATLAPSTANFANFAVSRAIFSGTVNSFRPSSAKLIKTHICSLYRTATSLCELAHTRVLSHASAITNRIACLF